MMAQWKKMKTSVRSKLVCMAGVLALVLAAPSETVCGVDSPVPEDAIVIPHPMTVLLRASSVHRELGLNAGQRTVLEVAVDEVDLPLWRLRDVPPPERNRAAGPLLQALRAKVSAALTTRQLERFDQLVVQAEGIFALFEPRVTDALELSNEQTERIRTALGSAAFPSGRAQRFPAEIERNVLALLSDRQRHAFALLRGLPFDFAQVRNVAARAPEFIGVSTWLGSAPVSLAQLRGKVVVVHFYTFGCVNCIRNLPHYNQWHERFGGSDFAVIGIHRPETDGERDIEKVRRKAAEAGLKYPVAVDNEGRNWDTWANRVWPSVYLIGKDGFVRYWWYGELNWQGIQGEQWMRARIAELLAEPGEALAGSQQRESETPRS